MYMKEKKKLTKKRKKKQIIVTLAIDLSFITPGFQQTTANTSCR